MRAHDARLIVVAWRPASDPARRSAFAHGRIHRDHKLRVGPGFENRGRLTDRGHHANTGRPSFGDLGRDREAPPVIAAEVVADADDYDVTAHVRSIVRVRKCAEHEMHGSWLRIDFSHSDVNVASSNVRFAVTSSAISGSIAAWFCAAG